MARYELQKPRWRADFNGCFGDILGLSHGDTCKTENDEKVTLGHGMIVTACEVDENEVGERDDLIATGVVERSSES